MSIPFSVKTIRGADGVDREVSELGEGGSGNGGGITGSVFVFRPGGEAGGNVFTSWSALVDAAAAVAGPKTVYFEAAATIPAGDWSAMSEVTLETPWPVDDHLITIEDGALIPGLRGLRRAAVLVPDTTPPVQLDTAEAVEFYLDRSVVLSLGAPLVDKTEDLGALIVQMDNWSGLLAASGPVFRHATSRYAFRLRGGSFCEAGTIAGAGSQETFLQIDSVSSYVDDDQPFTGDRIDWLSPRGLLKPNADSDLGSDDRPWRSIYVQQINGTPVDEFGGAVAHGLGIYGDGSDGNLTTSGNVNQVGAAFFENLTVENGHVYNPNGNAIFVKGTLTVRGTIRRTANDGSGSSAGAQSAAGSLTASGFGRAGGAGGTSGGSAGTDTSVGVRLGGTGGAGGAGTSGAGGAGGAGTLAANNNQLPHSSEMLALLRVSQGNSVGGWQGGAGGGGGGGNGTQAGGGGGAGGSAVYIRARRIVVEAGGEIHANGGDGAPGTASNCGGGGGGGGGFVHIICDEYTGDQPLALGGSGGASGGGSGVAGSDGAPGRVVVLIQRDA